ncbi:MAG: hypothetical protein Fur0032_11150 [Terrimicrobiaceae bacterium]
MRSLLALLALTPLFLLGCQTPHGSQPVVLQKLAASGIEPSTYAKIKGGRVLSYDDILGLVGDKVPGEVIVSYLKSTHAPYKLTTSQLERLSDAGADSNLVNYLGQSVGYYQANKRSQTGGSSWDKHPYFNDPYYWGPAPFAYDYPESWFDPEMAALWF